MFTRQKNGWSMKKKLNKPLTKIVFYLLFLYRVFVCNLCFADPAADPLATSVKPQIQALFGTGSTVAYAIYIAEIILGSVVYVKTKNLLTLLGVPILVLFTHAMFTYIGS